MKWCRNVKFILLALLVCSVALLSSCSKEIKYAINPYTNLTVDSENDESDELLFEREGEIDSTYLERAKQVFLVDYPKEEKEQLVDKTITIREPYTLFNNDENVSFHFTVYVEDEPYAYIGLRKYDEDTFATSFMLAKNLPERFPMKHGCYRFTAINNGMHIESVKYDSTKEYGNLNHVVYTFDPTEL
ncbi:MAG: hypothetical protein HXK75_03580 [Granulicatella sp.]|nr:hypothetical protein [Granulicatella sp.]